jgi:hypothetical protein
MRILKSILILVLTAAAAWADSAESGGSSTNYIVVPFDLSVFPMISTAGQGFKTIDIIQLNIFAGYTSRLQGFQAGIIDLAGENATGFQASAVISFSGGGSTGFQCSGAGNFTAGDLIGVQASSAFNYARSIQGAQFSVINFSAGPASFQAGVIDFAGGSIEGGLTFAQAGVVNISAGENLFQAGVVNISASSSNRVQIGVVNYSEDPDSVPIGLVSIVPNGVFHGDIWYDETGFLNAGLKLGSKNIYNIYALGTDTALSNLKATIGLGYHIPIDTLSCNIEALLGAVENTAYFTRAGFISSIRAGFGFELAQGFAITAGLSFNEFESLNTGASIQPVTGYKFPFGSSTSQFWPGFYVGVEF